MNYYPEFAHLLDQHLTAADRSAAWLAQRLGVNPATVTRWRNGDTRPGAPETVVRVADNLGLHEPTARQQLLHAAGYGYLDSPPTSPSPSAPAQIGVAPPGEGAVVACVMDRQPRIAIALPPLPSWLAKLPLSGLLLVVVLLVFQWGTLRRQ
jgi:transcriptional regulator with XRE-family HTH domain